MNSSRDLRHDLGLLVPGVVQRHLQWFLIVALASAVAAMAMTLLPFDARYGIVRDALVVVAVLSGFSLAGSPLFRPGKDAEARCRSLDHQALSQAYAIVAVASAGTVMVLSLLSDLRLLPSLALGTPDAPFFLVLVIALASLPALCRERLLRAQG